MEIRRPTGRWTKRPFAKDTPLSGELLAFEPDDMAQRINCFTRFIVSLPSLFSVSAVEERCRVLVSYMSGRMTRSMTWMTPFVASMSAEITVAPSILTFPPSMRTSTVWPLTVSALESFTTSSA